MHADLVRSSGAGLHPDERVSAKPLDDLVETAGILGVRIVLVVGDQHFDPVVRVVLDPSLDVIAVAVQFSGNDGRIFLEHPPVGEGGR